MAQPVIDPKVWEEINENWGSLREVLIQKLDINSMKRFDDSGDLVESDRPMMESIVCDKTEKSHRFFYYLFLADNETQMAVEPQSGRKIISVGVANRITCMTGGKQDVVKRGSR
jgi:hypothetical protein